MKTKEKIKKFWKRLLLFIANMWKSFRWLVKELVATCSDQPSYFSKKRIQSWILFDAAVTCLLWWFWNHQDELELMQVLEVYGALIIAAGYQISTIQREKRFNKKIEKGVVDKLDSDE